MLSFPDGMERIITLPRRKWAMYDKLTDHWVYPGLCEDECFSIAHQYGSPGDVSFEESLSYLFGLAIESGWGLLCEDLHRPVNQNRVK